TWFYFWNVQSCQRVTTTTRRRFSLFSFLFSLFLFSPFLSLLFFLFSLFVFLFSLLLLLISRDYHKILSTMSVRGSSENRRGSIFGMFNLVKESQQQQEGISLFSLFSFLFSFSLPSSLFSSFSFLYSFSSFPSFSFSFLGTTTKSSVQ